ncbi:MAG: TIGR04211 family SH3 domain-containing protein [Gammaproteobacteria bacterium]|nr:MAG: TIGR04211 family SH3 domain-containing protein [Gammaproteobacteria bacterium]
MSQDIPSDMKFAFITMSLLFLMLQSTVHAASPKPESKDSQRYITENLEITLRSGQGTKFQIIRMLRSGTPVTLLETDKTTGYSRVRTSNGIEGWVLSRFLSRHPSSKNQLTELRGKLTGLEIRLKQQAKELDKALSQVRKTTADNQELLKQKASLERELKRIKQAAGSTLAIDAKNKDLQQKLIASEHELQRLQQENQVLESNNSRKWFLYGGSFAVFCMLLGWLLPKLSWRRKSNWNTL